MKNIYQLFEEEKELLKKLGYILMQSKNGSYLYHVKTGTLKKITGDMFAYLDDLSLGCQNETKKFISMNNEFVNLFYKKEANEKSVLEISIHLTKDCTIFFSIYKFGYYLDFDNGDFFQHLHLFLNKEEKIYDFYFEDNIKKAVILYGTNDVYYYSGWNYLDCVNFLLKNEEEYLQTLLKILSSSTIQTYFEKLFPIIERYVNNFSSIIKEYPIVSMQRNLIESLEQTNYPSKKYVLKTKKSNTL